MIVLEHIEIYKDVFLNLPLLGSSYRTISGGGAFSSFSGFSSTDLTLE